MVVVTRVLNDGNAKMRIPNASNISKKMRSHDGFDWDCDATILPCLSSV